MSYLYRGLRRQEADQHKLLPKKIDSLEGLDLDGPMYAMADAGGAYTHVGGKADLILLHQQSRLNVGISTSKNPKIAARYATSGSSPSGLVVRIKRNLTGIMELDAVLLGLRSPSPLDEEIILVSRDGTFPDGLIDRYFRVSATGDLEELR